MTAQDAANRVTGALLGNGLKMVREYNPNTGYLSFGTLNNAQNQGQLTESYNYDALGNVKQRAQYWSGAGLVGFTEEFSYDGLNRLTSATVAGQPVQRFRYDGVGNLLSKTGVGTGDYVYAPAGGRLPHAVKSIPGIGTLDYDLNGNLLSGSGRALSWTSFDMPRSISKGSENSIFMYGPEHQRARQERNDGTTTYYAGAMEVEVKGGAPTVKTYWPMGLGVEIDKPTGSTELNWTHLDRLGSVVAISNAAGVVKEQLAYDSWGKRRKATGDGIPDCLDCVTDNRGYTGHEMLDKLDLVHMNGRIYDPLLARFMSADPLIQDPMHSQSYNRYTYVWNNPTNLTDPSGFAAKSESGNQTENIADRLMRENAERCEKVGGNCRLVGDSGNDKPSNSADNASNMGADKVSANNGTVAQTVAAASRSNIPGAKDAIPKEGEAINVGVNVILAAEGGVGIARAAPGLWAKFMALIGKEAAPESGQALYHYTTEAGMKGIVEGEKLFPSLKQLNPKDARYGNGQYLSDIAPGTKSAAQLSREFLGMPFQGSRFTHYVEIDVRGLSVVQGRPGVYVVPNEGELNLFNRIMSSGKNSP